jgi:hypothetical protein
MRAGVNVWSAGNRTRTYNPPVNSCTDGKTANYRQLRLILKTELLRQFQKRLITTNSEEDSLKKSPKCFSAPAGAPSRHWIDLRCDQEKLTALLRLKYHNSITDAIADLGKPEEISQVFAGFQKYLYQPTA